MLLFLIKIPMNLAVFVLPAVDVDALGRDVGIHFFTPTWKKD